VEGSSSRSGGYPGYGTASDTAEVLATFRETLARLGSEVEEMIREVTGSVGGYERWEADRDALNTYFSLWRDHLSDLEDEGIPPDDPDAWDLTTEPRDPPGYKDAQESYGTLCRSDEGGQGRGRGVERTPGADGSRVGTTYAQWEPEPIGIHSSTVVREDAMEVGGGSGDRAPTGSGVDDRCARN
jgi:hypothetical protein